MNASETSTEEQNKYISLENKINNSTQAKSTNFQSKSIKEQNFFTTFGIWKDCFKQVRKIIYHWPWAVHFRQRKWQDVALIQTFVTCVRHRKAQAYKQPLAWIPRKGLRLSRNIKISDQFLIWQTFLTSKKYKNIYRMSREECAKLRVHLLK